ncbi:MAG: hypothetical protein FWD57_12645 [Polyangiaceae bacterium]|nr:hypothetical protein [Polyangiaceae bacterium]
MRAIPLIAVSVLGLILGLAACGSDGGESEPPGNGGSGGAGGIGGTGGTGATAGGGAGGGDVEEQCITVKLRDPKGGYYRDEDDDGKAYEWYEYWSGLSTDTGGPRQGVLFVGLFETATGTFDLGSSTNADHELCAQCLWINEELDNGGNAIRRYFQKSGSLGILSSVVELNEDLLNATVKNVVLVEYDEDGPLTGGGCLRIVDEKLVIEPVEGWDCRRLNYNDGRCDCECGVWDPDCDTAGEVYGCDLSDAICEKTPDGSGVCAEGLSD